MVEAIPVQKLLPLSCATLMSFSTSHAAVTINIAQDGNDLVASVAGSLIGVTEGGGELNGGPATVAFVHDFGMYDGLFFGGALEGTTNLYTVPNLTDTGVMSSLPSSSLNYGGIVENVTGITTSIGASSRFALTSILIGPGYTSGSTIGYSVRWSSTSLASFGLSDGQSRTVEWDDGLGGRDSINWTVGATVVPEPSGVLLSLLGLGLLVTQRRRK